MLHLFEQQKEEQKHHHELYHCNLSVFLKHKEGNGELCNKIKKYFKRVPEHLNLDQSLPLYL